MSKKGVARESILKLHRQPKFCEYTSSSRQLNARQESGKWYWSAKYNEGNADSKILLTGKK